jgi:hypothetical protein
VSGVVGVDVDSDQGEKLLDQVSGGVLPETLEFSTGRGRRLLYAIPAGAEVLNRAWSGRGGGEVRVLSHGCITVAPPSWHASGVQYRWARRRDPDHIQPAPCPQWLLKPQPTASPPQPAVVEEGDFILEGERNARLFRLGAAVRGAGANAEEVLVILRLVNRRCKPPLSESELREITGSVIRYRTEPHIRRS